VGDIEQFDHVGGLTMKGRVAAFDAYRVKEGTRETSDVSGTSIFDPVLCELCYSWFSAPGHAVLDPFAGGSVRGIVASILGRRYTGIELRPEQVEANRAQLGICEGYPTPEWRCGDSAALLPAMAEQFDFLFTCPPYGNLEIYSDLPEDLSSMDWPAFQVAYSDVISAAVQRLRPNRFACFVVGNFRNKRGMYCDLVGATVSAFAAAGAEYYNEAVLVTAVGSLPVRINAQWQSGRKLGKTHQNVLVFIKGDPRKAAAEINGANDAA
jgi:16S rRNA G966 N2-methylase RsmD